MAKPAKPQPRAPARRSARVAVVVSRYNASVTEPLLKGAIRECMTRSGSEPVVYRVPGSFELPVVALSAAGSRKFDAVVALGCLIKGETSHDRYIAEAVAHGLIEVSMRTGVPVTFGVLTVDTPAQAQARAGGAHGNKGADAMSAALDAVDVVLAARAGRAPATAGRRALPDKASVGRTP